MRKPTDEVLAAARAGLHDQLEVVREELAQLTAEERALTQALANIDRDRVSAPGRATTGARRRTSGRSRLRRGASKPTAERVKELRALLADGPKSRRDLAATLEVSPARVQQLLSELGGAVSSQPHPEQRQGKL